MKVWKVPRQMAARDRSSQNARTAARFRDRTRTANARRHAGLVPTDLHAVAGHHFTISFLCSRGRTLLYACRLSPPGRVCSIHLREAVAAAATPTTSLPNRASICTLALPTALFTALRDYRYHVKAGGQGLCASCEKCSECSCCRNAEAAKFGGVRPWCPRWDAPTVNIVGKYYEAQPGT